MGKGEKTGRRWEDKEVLEETEYEQGTVVCMKIAYRVTDFHATPGGS